MSQIANRTKDAKLLAFVYEQVRDSLLANPTPAILSDVKGKDLMARMEMLKAADRFKATIEYGNLRQLPITDVRGLTYTKSVREVEPKSALEALIRYFTDSSERKMERQAVADAKAQQVTMAETQSQDARDYSVIRDGIAQELYRAAGVREKEVAPKLSREQIGELKGYAETLPLLSTDRKEFKEAARMAQEGLRQRENSGATRREALSPRELYGQPRDRSFSQVTNNHASDRDRFSRGR